MACFGTRSLLIGHRWANRGGLPARIPVAGGRRRVAGSVSLTARDRWDIEECLEGNTVSNLRSMRQSGAALGVLVLAGVFAQHRPVGRRRGRGAGGRAGAGDDRQRLGRDGREAGIRRGPADGDPFARYRSVRSLLRRRLLLGACGADGEAGRPELGAAARPVPDAHHLRGPQLLRRRVGRELGADRPRHLRVPSPPGGEVARQAAGQRARVHRPRRGLHLEPQPRTRRVRGCRPEPLLPWRHGAGGIGDRPGRLHRGVQDQRPQPLHDPADPRRAGLHPGGRG